MLRELSLASIALRTLLALVIGGVLGMERGRKNRPAGFRTYMLVCLGSAIVMMTNQYVFQQYQVSDPVRLGAQVISGIGFLGAGTIIVTGRNQVKGMTTAAGLWTAACCGLAIGIGCYEVALAGGLSVFLVMSVMQHVDERIRQNSKSLEIYAEFESKQPLRAFIEYARHNSIDIYDVQMKKNKLEKESSISLVFVAHGKTGQTHNEILDLLGHADAIRYIEELQ